MNDQIPDALARAIELLTVRAVACELTTRAMYQVHPDQQLVQTYLDRLVAATLMQGQFLGNREATATLKEAISDLTSPGPRENPAA